MQTTIRSGIAKRRIYRAAVYERLSKDDELTGDSTSIQNQRRILYSYAQENDISIIAEYSDDGWSGTNFNRPGFKRMISELTEKKINCIITKDLSRLGRNYLEVGYYLEDYFPSNGIRYIAINDNIDTERNDNEFAPIMNIFNEYHAKETSKKLRQVHEAQCKDGDCHYTYPPMGYDKNPENKKRLIPDPETAWVIKKIFELADEHLMGAYSIQRWLFDNKVETPGYREYRRWGAKARVYANCSEERKYQWGLANIKKILKDTVYIGHTVRYKQRSISFKNKKRVNFDPEEWSVKKNTHPPIIAEDRFYRVQSNISLRRRHTKDGEIQIFSGMARCSGCGRLLRFSTNRQRPGFEYQYLYCSTVDETVSGCCTRHYIRYDTLQEIILQKIQTLYESVKIDKQNIAYKLAKLEKENTENSQKAEMAELSKLEARQKEIQNIFPKIYEDWVAGRLNEQMFTMMSSKYQEEQQAIEERLSVLRSQVTAQKSELNLSKKWIEEVERHSYPTSLTRELVSSLIDKIVVHEAIGPKGSRKKTQVVEVYWKFVGAVDAA